MIARGLLIASATMLLAATAADSSVPTVAEGTPYASARARLIEQGHRPVPVVRTEENSHACRRDDGDWCERWPELEDCAGAGVSYCNFIFADRAGRPFKVTTIGETRPTVSRVWRDK